MYISNRINELENQIDKQKQYSRRNCIFINGIPGNPDEVTDKCAVNIVVQDMKVEISVDDIDRCHQLRNPRKNEEKARSKIIKIAWNNIQQIIFISKKIWKDAGIRVTDSLMQKILEI